jgi:predicted nucleic acid-binding protein
MSPLPRTRLLFDTSAYIRHIREGTHLWLATDRGIVERSILTVVVAAELYAGARDAEDKGRLDILCRLHRRLGTLSSPDGDTWLEGGQLLGRYARRYGNVRMVDHFRDVLIALEAVRNGAALMTENVRDFLRWRKLLLSSGTRLEVFDLRGLSRSL